MADPRNLPPPRTDVPRNGTVTNGTPPKLAPAGSRPGFLAPFLGALAGILILGLLGGGIYLGSSLLHSSPKKDPNSPLFNVASWQPGPLIQGALAEPLKPEIGWWARNFDLPNLQPEVADYLKSEGLTVNSVEPIRYEDTKDATTLTYQVNVVVQHELLRVPQAAWTPNNPDAARFARILVLNQGLPPGIYWDTAHEKVEVPANPQMQALFSVHWNKVGNVVTADRLLPNDLVTRDQTNAYDTESQGVMAALQQRLQQIDAQVAQDTQAQLAQVPADPPKPKLQVAHFGGDGSGEPTKSAERIGGGAAAGAAGGAIFGSMAGNAGEGAGIGAGVGLLSGIIYNAVSKSNDKKKLEAEVADENAEHLDNWHDEIKSLAKRRAQIKENAVKERAAALDNLANQINANQGHLEPITNAPAQEATSQPTGPVQQ